MPSASFETLIGLAGVSTIDELPRGRAPLSARERSARPLPELERHITEAGQAPLRELIDRAESVDIDALDAQATEAEEEIAALEEQLRLLDVRIGELGGEQQRWSASAVPPTPPRRSSSASPSSASYAERYLRLYLAAWALTEAIDAYRREHKAPLLKRADELFPTAHVRPLQGTRGQLRRGRRARARRRARHGENVPVSR